ncbi:MAG: Gfo/Idh/MocA family oxidoreductase [Gemmatimonadaceae bacterium]
MTARVSSPDTNKTGRPDTGSYAPPPRALSLGDEHSAAPTPTRDSSFGNSPLRVGIIGAGKMAANHVQSILQCSEDAVVSAYVDPSHAARLSMHALVPAATGYSTVDEMLSAEQLDVVHVCTPPGLHAKFAARALEAGCHVYVEKPFVETLREANALLELSRSRGLLIATGHQLLYESPTRESEKLLPALGRVTHIESYFSFRTVRRAPGGRVPLASDLQLLDILPHPVYLLLHFLDLSASGSPELLSLSDAGDGTIHALVRHGHVTGTLVVTLHGRPVESYVRVVGTNGSICADYVRGTVQRLIGPGTSGIDKALAPYRIANQLLRDTTSSLFHRVVNRNRSYPGLVELFDAFYAAVRTGTESPISEINILKTTELCEKVADSLRMRTVSTINPTWPSSAKGVLVTGGTGLLGSAIARELVTRGRLVRVVSRRRPASWEKIDKVDYVSADLGDVLPTEIFRNIDCVVHTAAETAGGWQEHQRNSVDATRHIVTAAAAAGVRNMIHVSSLAVIGRPIARQAIAEDTPLERNEKGYGPYVWGKLESERVAATLAAQSRVRLRVVRPGPLIDSSNFEPPGRLGRRLGNLFVAVGGQRHKLPVTDVAFAARTIAWMLDNPDDAPDTLNLLNPVLPTRRAAVDMLRSSNPGLSVIWLPRWLLLALSSAAVVAQKIARPRRPAINVAKLFGSPNYDTSLVKGLARRIDEMPSPVLTPMTRRKAAT